MRALVNLGTLSLLTLQIVACSHGSSDSASDTRQYSMTVNGCATGAHVSHSLAEYCSELLDDNLNNGCAFEERMDKYATDCSSVATPDPTQPTPAPTSTPRPSVTPSNSTIGASCFQPNILTLGGTEITAAEFLNGQPGHYRLTMVQAMALAQTADGLVSSSLSAQLPGDNSTTASLATGQVTCEDFGSSSAPYLTDGVKSPLQIARGTGALSGNLEAESTIYNPQLATADRNSFTATPDFTFATFGQLEAASTVDKAQLHIYKLANGLFQIQTRFSETNRDFIAVATYAFVADSQPSAPVVTPAPVDPTLATDSQLLEICKEGYTPTDRANCMLQFKNGRPSASSLPICKAQYTPADESSCLKKMIGKSFTPGVIAMCQGQYTPAEEVSCMESLANVAYTDMQIELCKDAYTPSEEVSCLKKFAPSAQ